VYGVERLEVIGNEVEQFRHDGLDTGRVSGGIG